jgi:hypothetical protein
VWCPQVSITAARVVGASEKKTEKRSLLAVTLVRAVDRGGVTRSLQVLECTCFTGTKVQMLPQVQEEAEAASTQLQYAVCCSTSKASKLV